jgi:hypothetical protein
LVVPPFVTLKVTVPADSDAAESLTDVSASVTVTVVPGPAGAAVAAGVLAGGGALVGAGAVVGAGWVVGAGGFVGAAVLGALSGGVTGAPALTAGATAGVDDAPATATGPMVALVACVGLAIAAISAGLIVATATVARVVAA